MELMLAQAVPYGGIMTRVLGDMKVPWFCGAFLSA